MNEPRPIVLVLAGGPDAERPVSIESATAVHEALSRSDRYQSRYELIDRPTPDELNALILREAWFTPLLYGVNYAAAPQRVRNLDRLMGWDGKMDLREIWLQR